MDKLNYQQASNIRNRSLKDLIADELIRGKGIGGALGGAIGLRTQARIKGIKEKFDPLNIVKFLTFGSRLGPALYGRLFGRSRKDIEYFTGRASAIGSREQKIGALRSSGDEDIAGMKAVLNQILTFLNKSHEKDMILRERENNLRESNKLAEDRRHKELLKALGQNIPTIIPEQKEEENKYSQLFKNIFAKLKGLADLFNEMRKLVIKIAEKVGIKVGEGLLKASRFALGALASPVGAVAIASTVVAGAAKYLQDKQIKKAAERGDKKEVAKLLLDQAYPAETLFSLPPEDQVKAVEEVNKLADDVIKSVKGEKNTEATPENKTTIPKTENQSNEQNRRFSQGKLSRLDNNTTPAAVVTGTNTPSSTTPVLMPNAAPPVVNTPLNSEILNAITKENVSLNLPTNTTNKALEDASVNKIINTPQRTGKKIPMPAVRNLENSFQRMIINSTRVV